MWSVVTATAVQAGRDASELPLVVRANIQRTSRPLGAHRPTCHGSVEQIAADGRGALRVGAHQVILELQGTTSDVSEYFHLADAIVDAADVRTAA